MKKILKNKKVVKAMSIGLSAFMGMATPISAFASELEDTNDNVETTDTSSESSSESEYNEVNNEVQSEIESSDETVEEAIETVSEAVESNNDIISDLDKEKDFYADDDQAVIVDALETVENVNEAINSTKDDLNDVDKDLDEIVEAIDELNEANNTIAEANDLVENLNSDYDLIITTVESQAGEVEEAVVTTNKEATVAESLAVIIETAQATEYINDQEANEAKQQALKDAAEANQAYETAGEADENAGKAVEIAKELIDNAEKDYIKAEAAYNEAEEALKIATSRLESLVPIVDGEVDFEEYIANKAVASALSAYNNALGAYNEASSELEKTENALLTVIESNKEQIVVTEETVRYLNKEGEVREIEFGEVYGKDAIIVYNRAYPDKPEAVYYNYTVGTVSVTFNIEEVGDSCIIRRTKTDIYTNTVEVDDLVTYTKDIKTEDKLVQGPQKDTLALEEAVKYLTATKENAYKAQEAANKALEDVKAAMAEVTKLRAENVLNKKALDEAVAKREQALKAYNQALEAKAESEENVARAQEAAKKAAELAGADFKCIASAIPLASQATTTPNTTTNTTTSNTTTTNITTTNTTTSNTTQTIADTQTPLSATPSVQSVQEVLPSTNITVTEADTVSLVDENVALASSIPSSTKDTSVQTTGEDALITIDDVDTALAATIQDESVKTNIVSNKTSDMDKANLTISDEDTPLAANPIGEKRISWWWLLVIAVLGKTGYEMYKRDRKKKLALENDK